MPTTNDVSQQCVALASGTLEPDLRVNYEFGLVLGVGEFRQEQMHGLEAGRQANRSLHGYGTAYGLLVSLDRPVGVATDLQATVATGMGIDQPGRAFVVRTPQCARLGAWLAKQPAETVARYSGFGGALSIYVVAQYDECLDALVPIPGQPCSSMDAQQAPSRIRDAHAIAFRFEPPAMPAWDAVRLFGELFLAIQLVPGLDEADSDEPQLATLIRLLDQPGAFAAAGGTGLGGSPLGPGPLTFRLPRETAREALDRLATIWVTEVRPRILPDLTAPAPDTEAGVLLARIDLDWQNGAIADGFSVDNAVRPFLLHTQLLQELIYPPGAAAGVAERPSQEFASLQVRGPARLRAWVHHPASLALPDRAALTLLVDDVLAPLGGVTQVADNVFDLDLSADDGPPPLLQAGARVSLGFDLTLLELAGGGPLLSSVDAEPFGYVGRDGDQIVVSMIPDDRPTSQFVTFHTLPPDAAGGRVQVTAWFHTDRPLILPQTLAATRGVNNQPVQFSAQAVGGANAAFLWRLTLLAGQPLADGDLLTFSFDLGQITDASGAALATQILDSQRGYLGWDGDRTIRAFHVATVPRVPEAPIDPLTVPVLPFVTVTPMGQNVERPTLELWFHPSRRAPENVDEIIELETTLFAELAAEEGESPDLFITEIPIELQRTPRRNIWRAMVTDPERWKEAGTPHYLRFVFKPDAVLVRTSEGDDMRLSEYIEKNRLRFEGNTPDGLLVNYVRV